MPTPYKILQLKQKQTKKILIDHQKQRSFSIRYNKNGDRATQYLIERDKPRAHSHYRNLNQDHKKTQMKYLNDSGIKNTDKKYQIIFRQAIRKVNAQRTKIYHPQDLFKKQKFFDQFVGGQRQNKYLRHLNSRKKQLSPQIVKTIKQGLQDNHFQGKCEKLNVGRFRITLKTSPQKYNQNQIIPEIFVQKCKLNPTNNQNKLKIQQSIQTLYDNSGKIYSLNRRFSLDSCFTERDDLIEYNQSKVTNFDPYQNLCSFKKNQKGFRINTDAQKLSKQVLQNFRIKMTDSVPQGKKTDCTEVANFIKSKKKKRLPMSKLKNNNEPSFQFQRSVTVTDDFSNNSRRISITKNPQEGYFLPDKGSNHGGVGIKFNTIEQNISGWQFHPWEIPNLHHENTLKNPLLQI